MKKQFNQTALRADFLLLLTAAIWGFGFVAQRSGMEYIGPFAFNGIRFLLGSLSLLPIILVRLNQQKKSAEEQARNGTRELGQSDSSSANPGSSRTLDFSSQTFRQLVISSMAAGGILFVAVILQQFGIIFTTAGNAGFITGLYVVFTPALGIFLGRKTGFPTWIGSLLTLTGLYFISIAGRPSINPGDIIVIISAVFWTAHVLLIDRFMHSDVKRDISINPVELSAGQFAVCGILSLICAFAVEPFVVQTVESIDPSLLEEGLFSWLPFPVLISAIAEGTVFISAEALIPILYGGLCSAGIAYTLQVVAQRDAPPAHATIILCFEGCFAALGGVLLLSEKIGVWTLLGFSLMLAGMMATQLDTQKNALKNSDKSLTEMKP